MQRWYDTGEDLTQLGTARSPQEEDNGKASEVDRTPTFIVQPADFYYVTRTKPTTIMCRAVDAVQINFKCVEQWVSPTQHHTEDGVETAPTRRQYIQVRHFEPLYTLNILTIEGLCDAPS